jgi:hypothetical protein
MTASQNSNNSRNVIPDTFKHIHCCQAYYLLRSIINDGVIKVYSNVARTRTAPTGIVGLLLANFMCNNLSSS